MTCTYVTYSHLWSSQQHNLFCRELKWSHWFSEHCAVTQNQHCFLSKPVLSSEKFVCAALIRADKLSMLHSSNVSVVSLAFVSLAVLCFSYTTEIAALTTGGNVVVARARSLTKFSRISRKKQSPNSLEPCIGSDKKLC